MFNLQKKHGHSATECLKATKVWVSKGSRPAQSATEASTHQHVSTVEESSPSVPAAAEPFESATEAITHKPTPSVHAAVVPFESTSGGFSPVHVSSA